MSGVYYKGGFCKDFLPLPRRWLRVCPDPVCGSLPPRLLDRARSRAMRSLPSGWGSPGSRGGCDSRTAAEILVGINTLQQVNSN